MVVKMDKIETKVSHAVCPFHQVYPGQPYAGCTCSASYIGLTHERFDGKVKDEGKGLRAPTQEK